MGSFSNLYFGKRVVDSWKNTVDGLATSLFTEHDRIFVRSQSLCRYSRADSAAEELETDPEALIFEYEASVQEVIDRLEIFGFTMARAKGAFVKGLTDLLDARSSYHLEARQQLSAGDLSDQELRWYQQTSIEEESSFCNGYTFDLWLQFVNRYLHDDDFAERHDSFGLVSPDSLPIADHLSADCWLGFPNEDPRYAARAMLQLLDADDFVVLDCSDLLYGGWIEQHEELCSVEPMILILTEGPTDIDILEPSLYSLYPHLAEYYHFMDFRTLNIQANAVALANLLKAFIGARMSQRVIAVFDNDAAACDVLRSLSSTILPDNMKVVRLPELEFARNYPTIGPQGDHFADVNGRACNIELYLGRDMLLDESGALYPVEWGGYMPGVQRYQGEIRGKKAIQQKYQALMNSIDYEWQAPDHDWEGMRLVCQSILNAFKS